jgi:hypothetical protein
MYIQCIREIIQTSSLFPHFATLQPYSKIDQIKLFLINLHTIAHNDKSKTAKIENDTFISTKFAASVSLDFFDSVTVFLR